MKEAHLLPIDSEYVPAYVCAIINSLILMLSFFSYQSDCNKNTHSTVRKDQRL